MIDIQKQQGLYYDFTDYLNRHSEHFTFDAVHVPRKRIERMLIQHQLEGILLGVNPVWFDDKEQQKYFWSAPFTVDRDEIVSLASTSFEFTNPESFIGKVFGGVRGFYYFGINELVKQQKLQRVNTANEVDLFYMLLNQRIDVAVISNSTFSYMVKKNNWQQLFHLSKKPHDIYNRKVLVPKHLPEIFNDIDDIIATLPANKSWLNILKQYH